MPSLTGLVASIDVRGAPSPELARRALATRQGEPFDAARIQDDLRALWALQLFDDVSVLAEPLPSGVALTYVVVPRPTIDRVTFSGAQRVPEAELAALVADLRGSPANPVLVDDAVRRVRDHYAELGYRLARVETEQSRTNQAGGDPGPVEVRMVIDEGPRVVLDRWTFTGNVRVKEAELRRQMASGTANTAGGLYSEALWERSVVQISAYYFDRGMLQVQVGPVELTPSADGSALSATVPIVEGPVFHVGTVEVTDSRPEGSARRSAGALHTKRGEVFDRTRIKADLDRLRAWYAAQLHRKVTVTPQTEIDVPRATMNLVFRVADADP